MIVKILLREQPFQLVRFLDRRDTMPCVYSRDGFPGACQLEVTARIARHRALIAEFAPWALCALAAGVAIAAWGMP